MPQDLVVPANETLALNEEGPRPDVADALSVLTLERLTDLVDAGILDSADELERLVTATAEVTTAAVEDLEVHRARKFVPGLRRPDLGRYARMLAAVPDIDESRLNVYWRIVREVDAAAAIKLRPDAELNKPISIGTWLFSDVTVDPGGTLHLQGLEPVLQCRNLVIRANGRIVATGRTLHINATTIKGE